MPEKLLSTEGHQNRSQRLLLALSQATQKVLRARSSEEVYRAVGSEVVALGLQAVIFRLTDDRTHLQIPFLTFESGLLRAVEKLAGVRAVEYLIPIKSGSVYDQVIRENNTIYLDNVVEPLMGSLRKGSRSKATKILKVLNLQQAIYAPLIVDGQLEGIFLILGPILDPEDQPAVSVFANQIAGALENVKLIEDIRQSELKFRQIIENIADGVAVTVDNHYYWVSPAFADMFGYAPEEMLGYGHELVVAPQGLELLAERDRKRAAGDTIASFIEVPAIHKTGKQIHIHITSRQVQFDGQNAIQIVVRDITTRIQREEQLDIFRQFIEAAGEGFGMATMDGKIHYANPALIQMVKETQLENLHGKSIVSYYPPNFQQLFKDEVFPSLMEHGCWNGETELVAKTGESFPVAESYFLIRNQQGQPIYVADVITDISARKNAQAELRQHRTHLEELIIERTQALKEREELLIALMDASEDTIALIDVDGNVLSINRNGAERYGKTPDELVGKDIHTFMGADVSEDRKALVDQVFETGVAASAEDFRAGIYGLNDLYPVKNADTGEVEKVALFAKDITDRKRDEEKLRQSEARFRSLFDGSPFVLWEEDFSAVKTYLDEIKSKGVDDLRDYFSTNPTALANCLQQIKILNVNQAAVDAFETSSVENLMANQDKFFLPEAYEIFAEELIAFDNGELSFEGEIPAMTLKGKPIETYARAIIPPGYEHTWEKVFVSSVEITERKQFEGWIAGLNQLKEELLTRDDLQSNMRHITEAVVNIFGADFCRLWIIKPGDRCELDCVHATGTKGPHVCHVRDRCLHLVASSGRYTHIDGEMHRRVPLGAYKIGRVATGDESKLVTNQVLVDPRIHDHQWASDNGLASFAGYKISSDEGDPRGVLALFSQSEISERQDGLIETIANTASQLILMDRAETELRESEARYRLLAEASPEMIFVIDRDDRIQYLNTQAAEQFGKHPQDVIGKQIANLFPPEISQQQSDSIQQVFDSGEKLYAENPIQFPGYEAWLSTWLVPIVEQNKVQAVLGISQNITERKQTEGEIALHVEELERFNRLAIGREMRIIELKQKVNELMVELGREPLYASSYGGE